MDRIALRGIRAWGRHGNDDGERDVPQAFDVDVEIDADLRAAQRSDDLRDTLDYAALHRRLEEIVQTTSFRLLERLAAELCEAVATDARVLRATVTVAKPARLGGATPSVTVSRQRSGTHRAYVGIGSNLGDPVAQVNRAFGALAALGAVERRSSLYRTKPWGEPNQPDFVNAVVSLVTSLEPSALLTACKSIERELGRVPGERWGPRAIDLDVLTYDDAEIDEPGLRLPHVHLRDRAFVLVPLCEIDASYRALAAGLDPSERAGVTRLPDS